jgi:hypothetical protein
MTTQKQRSYAKKLREITKRFANLETDTVKRSVALLEQLRKDIIAQLATGGTEFDAYWLQQVQGNINDMITGYDALVADLAGSSASQAYTLGGNSVVEPAISGGMRGVFYRPNQAQLNILIDYSADLITNINSDMRSAINRELVTASLGGKSPLDVMKNITNILGVKNGRSLATGVSARSEKIYRTELGRVYELSAESQRQVSKELEPNLQKRWLSTGDNRTRDSHLAAHGQIVPVDEPFLVDGEELNHPKDPGGSAGNTINCRCTVVTIWPEIGPIETLNDQLVEEERKRRLEESGDSAEGVRNQILKLETEKEKELGRIQEELKRLEDKATENHNEKHRIIRSYDDPYIGLDDPRVAKLEQENTEIFSTMNSLYREEARVKDEYLKKQRELLYVSNPTKVRMTGYGRFTRTDVRKTPIREGVEFFENIVSVDALEKGGNVTFFKAGRGRSFHSDRTGIGLTTSARQATVIHEMGHWLESVAPQLEKKVHDFFERRTYGENLQWMGDLTGNKNYDRWEMAYKDDFLEPYMGKEYIRFGKRYSTEITSMGIQWFYQKPAYLAENDKEYFDFIYNLLRGQ